MNRLRPAYPWKEKHAKGYAMKIIQIHLPKKQLIKILALVLAFGCAVGWGMHKIQRASQATGALLAARSGTPALLLDAGHGGEDGGAVGVDGTIEKEINLPVAQKLEIYLRALGYQTEMTRREDKAIYDPSAKTLREKKVSDIHNRFALLEQMGENALFISIHQNHFTGEKYHGTQVFYSKNNPLSQALAKAVQAQAVAQLQPENTRQAKPSGTEIYLLWHAQIPAVLVECGFISNYAETQKLKQVDYQNKMAFSIACGVLDYTSAE